jgi:hypothetical protein
MFMTSYVHIVSLSSGDSGKSNQDPQKSKKHLLHSVPRIGTLNCAQKRACAYIGFYTAQAKL